MMSKESTLQPRTYDRLKRRRRCIGHTGQLDLLLKTERLLLVVVVALV